MYINVIVLNLYMFCLSFILLSVFFFSLKTSKGFSYWKDATMLFKKHQETKTHREAVEAVITLPKTTGNVGELLNKTHKAEKENSRRMLDIIFSSVRYLARQGLALRGDTSDESNLIQLLRVRAEDNPQVTKWLEKATNKYTSPENQNEMLMIMAHHVLQKIMLSIHSSPFLCLMVDEATDVSNKEQLTIIIRWVDEDLNVFEDFVGLYHLMTTDAASIVAAIKDVLLRLQIPFSKLRGQCYDGCSTMAGTKAGVAARIQQEEAKAIFTHCYGHALNLSVGDTIKRCKVMKDCLDTCFELIKLMKWSPKRAGMLTRIKEEIGDSTPDVRTLCPTRWTVRANSLSSVMENYSSIRKLWEEALETTHNTEMKARIQGVDSQMATFGFFFGLVLSEKILRHTDALSRTLQKPELSSAEGQEIARLTVKTLQSIRTESAFDDFWLLVERRRELLDVEEPTLPRRRKTPRRFDAGNAAAEYPSTAKDMYRQVYYEALDLSVTSITDRFDQPGFKVYSNVEQLLFKACTGDNYQKELDAVCTFYKGDLEQHELLAQLEVLKTLYIEKAEGDKPSVACLRKILCSLSPAQRSLIDVVCRAFQLLLIMPATNATSERSFSALRRIKSYLRSTMTQARLNHLAVLNYHQGLTDSLDMKKVANDFISANEARKKVFAMY